MIEEMTGGRRRFTLHLTYNNPEHIYVDYGTAAGEATGRCIAHT